VPAKVSSYPHNTILFLFVVDWTTATSTVPGGTKQLDDLDCAGKTTLMLRTIAKCRENAHAQRILTEGRSTNPRAQCKNMRIHPKATELLLVNEQ
jgi:hypothetical protein